MPAQQIANYLPPIPKPPDDPTFLLLNGRVGWRENQLDNIVMLPAESSLALAPRPGTGRSLAEASGSFGGLDLPSNVAIGSDCNIYLLDRDSGVLKRFDPCECQFRDLPCFTGLGKGPRHLLEPHGIGICNGNLFVCDKGNRRLSIFLLRGLVLKAVWRPPVGELDHPWQPCDVAFDRRGNVFVSDRANGCVHIFSPRGHWQNCLAGFPGASALTIDCEDHLYVLVNQGAGVKVSTLEGETQPTPTYPGEVSAHFAPLPIPVDKKGNLHLTSLCLASDTDCRALPPALAGDAVFDLAGRRLDKPSLSQPIYHQQGTYLSGPLDSSLYRCQWHRIVVQGSVPEGTQLIVSTFTAETEQPLNHILGLPPDAWETNQTIHHLNQGEWDCLVRSGGGRYLWLRLTLRSNGKDTPAIEYVRVEFPRISLRRYLPAVFGEDPISADFTDRFLSLFDSTLRSVERVIDNEARFFDPLSTPAVPDPETGVDFLSWLASWIGLTLDRHWPETKRRRLVKQAGKLYNIRGTSEGIHRQLMLFLGIDPDRWCCPDDQSRQRCRPDIENCVPREQPQCQWRPPRLILEHYQLRRWLFLGEGRLGDQAALWGNRIANRSQLDQGARIGGTQIITTQDPYLDPFHVYAHKFSVFVPACYGHSQRLRKGLENLLEAGKPAHTTYQLEYVEPRFRIGVQSMLGFDAVIGRYPDEPVTLDETKLGEPATLSPSMSEQGSSTLEVGEKARVGTTTKLA